MRRDALQASDDAHRIGLDVELAHAEQRFRLIVIGREFVIAKRPAAMLMSGLGHEFVRRKA